MRNITERIISKAFLLLVLCLASCSACAQKPVTDQGGEVSSRQEQLIIADERTDVYFPLLKDKRIAIFSNHTGVVQGKHVLDILLENHFNVTAIFSPEHGFRGDKDAGEKVSSSVDPITGVPILSLYDGGSNMPSASSMSMFDVLLIDIQDVGLRYYTYYITMCHLMEACSQYQKKAILLDRPNPNGHMVDGPILDMRYKSGVGYLPIPIMHGMTLGELALMANKEGWLKGGCTCDLEVVPCLGYTHQTMYQITVAPSPNLSDMKAIYLYPSLCYFEAMPVSVGRGTDFPFMVYGHPLMQGDFTFTPHSTSGAKNPPCKDQQCKGRDLRTLSNEEIYTQGINLDYLIEAYNQLKGKVSDKTLLTSFFENLMGVGYVREMIQQGKSSSEIRQRWQKDVEDFRVRRQPYLLYPDNP